LAPEFLAKIIAAGARELRGTERPSPALANLQPEAGDEDLVALGCRRVTFECLLRQHVLEQGDVELVGGVQVSGLLAARANPPAVAGVRYRAGNEERALCAHLIVDASGRRSAAPEWLEEIGARRPLERMRPSGMVYYTRFYRLRPGAGEPPQTDHPTAGDFDWIKYAVFPADGGTFSITLAVPLAVQRLRVLSKPPAFDEMVRSIPGLAPWADTNVAEPIGDTARPVQAVGGLINRLRHFVDDGGPRAGSLGVSKIVGANASFATALLLRFAATRSSIAPSCA
jgi:hypothetical protein